MYSFINWIIVQKGQILTKTVKLTLSLKSKHKYKNSTFLDKYVFKDLVKIWGRNKMTMIFSYHVGNLSLHFYGYFCSRYFFFFGLLLQEG